MPHRATLLLTNAHVLTLEPGQPALRQAQGTATGAVAVSGETILAVGDPDELAGLKGPGTRVVDCGGHTLLPGFHDAHCHVLAYAASLRSLDCRPPQVRTIADIQALIARRARETPPGAWIRGVGYHEHDLAEGRHPTHWDLDAAAPNHPVRLYHRSGHAVILNSVALSLVGIARDTPDPVGGHIQRDPATGEPTGLLLELDDWVERAVSRPSDEEVRRDVREASQRLLGWGVTAVQDATAANDLQRWGLLRSLKADGTFAPRLTVMPGVAHLRAFLERGLAFGAEDGHCRLGHAKVMLAHDSTGGLHPSAEELTSLVSEAQSLGFPVAVHAVEAEAVEAALAALCQAHRDMPPSLPPHRLEHASELSGRALGWLRGTAIQVVTNPAFVYHNGDRYLAQVPRRRQPWLYRGASLLAVGQAPAAGSDVPVVPPNPLVGVCSAITRRTREGAMLSPQEAVSPLQALEMHTRNPARATGLDNVLGSLAPGKLADLVVLDRDPLRAAPEELLEARVLLTVVGGQVVWEG